MLTNTQMYEQKLRVKNRGIKLNLPFNDYGKKN